MIISRIKRGVKIFKIVIVNEWLEQIGGAEKVCSAILELFDHPIENIALWNSSSSIKSTESILRFFPSMGKRYKALLSFFIFRYFYLRKEFDLVISISHLFAHTVRFKKSRKLRHINYILTPARYIWQPNLDSRLASWPFLINILKWMDLHSFNKKAINIAISQEVQSRIQHFWGAESRVIYPPVDVAFFQTFLNSKEIKNGYLMSAGRFVPYKNHKQTILVASQLNRKVVLSGDGPECENLRMLARRLGVELEMHIAPSRECLANLLANASVFIHPAIEDFGILPIEALATGTPVVGLSLGSLPETINESSGVLVPNFDGLADAVLEAEKLDRKRVSEQSERFSKERFAKEFRSLLDEVMA